MKRRGHSQDVKSGGQKPRAQRKIIVYIATSADGYIARPDGSVDWLNRPMPKPDPGCLIEAPKKPGAVLREVTGPKKLRVGTSDYKAARVIRANLELSIRKRLQRHAGAITISAD